MGIERKRQTGRKGGGGREVCYCSVGCIVVCFCVINDGGFLFSCYEQSMIVGRFPLLSHCAFVRSCVCCTLSACC